ncbi:tyrosine-type recombinase/integrase [Virgibacillus sp. FSP13]
MLIETVQKEFIADKRFEGLKENSIISYQNLFRHWNEWLNAKEIIHIEDLSQRIIKRYLIYCTDELQNKPKTVNSKLRLLRVFAKWLYLEKLTDSILTQGIKTQREDQSPKIVRTDDLRLLLSHLRRNKRIEKTFTARRNYIIVLTLIGTGLRVGELTQLTWSDIDFQEHTIRIQVSKSRKAQQVPLSDALARELLDWRLFLANEFDSLPRAAFTTEKGNPVSRTAIQNVFKRLKKTLNIQGHLSPHAMRNYYLKTLVSNGANLFEVQNLARHSDIAVTRQYIGYMNKELKETVDKFSPLNDLI